MKKNKLTIQQLLDIAESLGWHCAPCHIADNEKGYELSRFSPANQDFVISIESTNQGVESHQALIDNLDKYIRSYDPSEEALLWVGPDGHGRKGAPYELKDIIADMEACLQMMKELLNAWKGIPKNETRPFTVYRTIRIDGQYDPARHDGVDKAIEYAVQKVINDALAHTHTIEEGIEITDVTDCGDTV